MDQPLANIITILTLDRLISLAFIYMLVRMLLGAKPMFPQRPPTVEGGDGHIYDPANTTRRDS